MPFEQSSPPPHLLNSNPPITFLPLCLSIGFCTSSAAVSLGKESINGGLSHLPWCHPSVWDVGSRFLSDPYPSVSLLTIYHNSSSTLYSWQCSCFTLLLLCSLPSPSLILHYFNFFLLISSMLEVHDSTCYTYSASVSVLVCISHWFVRRPSQSWSQLHGGSKQGLKRLPQKSEALLLGHLLCDLICFTFLFVGLLFCIIRKTSSIILSQL